MITPPVGFTVQFFPNADHEPKAAITAVVTRAADDGSGKVKLNLLYEGGGEMRTNGEWVRHVSDPWVSENKHELLKARSTAPRGAWDWVPGLTPRGSTERDRTHQRPSTKEMETA